ncbi:LMBR1-like_membrane protein [Hexamita inflata]|uniref:LMBR1-like membrane protein n=1 Tax=Hexamita inflata TaxID=28002 RepID=A0AA86TY54_9EUKA|nr:LMBR1-like membrane protein [Hexamita inflata]
MINIYNQLYIIITISAVIQLIYSALFLFHTTQRKRAQDMDKNHRFKPSYHLHLTIPTLVTVVIAFAYAIFTFHLAIADISLSFSSDYNSDSLYSVWNTIQWSYFIYDFGPGLLVQACQFSAHPSQLFSFWRAATREFWFYGITIGIIFLLGIFTIILGKVFTYTTFLGCVLTVKNSFVTVYFVIVFSFGLQELPRQIMYAASPVMMLNNLKYDALKQKEYIQILSTKFLQFKQQLDIYQEELKYRIINKTKLSIKPQSVEVSSKDAKILKKYKQLQHYIDHIKDITRSSLEKLETFNDTKQPELDTMLIQLAQSSVQSIKPQPVETLNKNIKKTQDIQTVSNYRLNVLIERVLNEYKYVAFRVEREFQVMRNIVARYKKYTNLRQISKNILPDGRKISRKQKIVTKFIRPTFLWIAFIFFLLVSLFIVYSNFLLVNSDWVEYSPLYMLIHYSSDKNLIAVSVTFVYYLHVVFVFYGMNASRMGITFKISGKKGTDPKSTVFYANRLTTLLFVLSWNLSQILGISEDTAFFKGVGSLQQIPIFGIQLMTYLPIIIFAVYIMWAFKIQRVVRAIFTKKSTGINRVKTIKNHSTQHYVLADIEYKLLKQCYQLYIHYFGKYLCYFIRWNVMLSELSIFLIFLNLKVPNTFYITTILKQQFKIFFKQLYF